MSSRPDIYGLILAGGNSRRMGQDKALLRHDGRSQLESVFTLLQAVTERQFVSVRRDQQGDPERSRYPQIVDQLDDMGPVAGILAAMHLYPRVDWLVVACDLPNLDRETLESLLLERVSDSPFTAYRSSHDGLPEPLCSIYRAGSDAIIRAFVDEGLLCPRKMLMRSNTRLLDQPTLHALDNVNTQEDLAASVLQASK